ncbi:MAG: hypothetical protein M1817_002525 [Caeruleum heppii]|nr:MAG: hypothetical protein M1817_002525 [Caeruleum heppii]
MGHLQALPHELLDDILSLLHPDLTLRGDLPNPTKQDLCNVCLTSRKLRCIAQPKIFSSLQLRQRTWRLRPFLAAVVSNRQLAQAVESLYIHNWVAWDRTGQGRMDEPTLSKHVEHQTYPASRKAADWIIIRRGLNFIDPPNKADWGVAITRDVDEVWIAMLLLLLPNVRSLDLHAPARPVFLRRALKRSFQVNPSSESRTILPSLRSLIWRSWSNSSSSGCLQSLELLFSLPSLESIVLWDNGGPTEEDCKVANFRDVKLRSCQFSSLRLEYCCIETGTLGRLIGSSRSLKQLELHNGGSLIEAESRDEHGRP